MDLPLNQEEFLALPTHVRMEVELWLRWLSPLIDSRPGRTILNEIAKKQSVSLATVYRKLFAFKKYGWSGLINRAKFPSNPLTPSPDFRAFLHGLWLLNKKSYRATHEQVVAMWKGEPKFPASTSVPKQARDILIQTVGRTPISFIL